MFNWLRYWKERRDQRLIKLAKIFRYCYDLEVKLQGPNGNEPVYIVLAAEEFAWLTAYLETVTGTIPTNK